MAAKYIRRLSTALLLAFFIRYLQTLPTEQKEAMKTKEKSAFCISEWSIIICCFHSEREMNHKDALKAFRSGSTMPSIVPRMSLLDTMIEVHETIIKKKNTTKSVQTTQAELLGVKSLNTDILYVKRIVSPLHRQGGIFLTEDTNKVVLPDSILEMKTEEIRAYLIKCHFASYSLFGISKTDEPHLEAVHGPKELLQKVKASKRVTIKRRTLKRPDTN
ncbi:hypothetical protein MAR_001692 [Mya arenaria]|uniref:Uncharacterized protein n=1 Tax=Mya arenaria TaxID=6604 RepID=A0ABY7FFB9_MYAAR|nr:hypothetical protein MAR_001692 [Mya arenaria]